MSGRSEGIGGGTGDDEPDAHDAARTDWRGSELIALGASEGPALGRMLGIVNARAHTVAEVGAVIEAHRPPPELPQRDEPAPCVWNITGGTEDELENLAKLRETMDVVLRTVIDGAEPAAVLDAGSAITHFGPGGRGGEDRFALPEALAAAIDALPFAGLGDVARGHMGTQGDGNHFLYVGRLESSGQTVLVTHHGSRGVGARLYKAGMAIAERHRRTLSPSTPKQNAWIPADTDDGRTYWEALQVVREWTRRNHESIHERVVERARGRVAHRRWNEHNFVFREADGDGALFWHAKGATPIHDALLPDTDGVQIVPLNMAEPVLFVRGDRNATNLGFAPHGAGRNTSRTRHKKRLAGRSDREVFAAETAGIDARFHCGRIDVSELPSAYKSAAAVQADMARFELAEVVDRVLPHGSIMAGDWEHDAPWKRRRRERAHRGAAAGADDAREENARWPT